MSLENFLEEKQDNNILVKIDEFEDKIKELDELTKQYNEIKKEIKESMLKISKENNLDQVKWTTPKGIKITLSVGKEAEWKTKERTYFNEELLKEKYPEIYQECLYTKQVEEIVKNASNDRLVITLGGKNGK